MNEATSFRPLDMQRVIRDDSDLSAVEKCLLLVAVLRTDNRTRRVRASLGLLATDAGCGYRTARRVFGSGNGRVLRYFEQVDRHPRAVHLTFADSTALKVREATVAALSHVGAAAEEDTKAVEAATVTDSGGHSGPPSASLSLTSAGIDPDWLANNAPSFEDDPEPGGRRFHVEHHERPQSRLSEDKQRQLYEQQMARDEGLNEYGEPIDLGQVPARYTGRNRV